MAEVDQEAELGVGNHRPRVEVEVGADGHSPQDSGFEVDGVEMVVRSSCQSVHAWDEMVVVVVDLGSAHSPHPCVVELVTVTVEVLWPELLEEEKVVKERELLLEGVPLVVGGRYVIEAVGEVETGETVVDVLAEVAEDGTTVEDIPVEPMLEERLDEARLTVAEVVEALLSVEEGLNAADVLEGRLEEEEDDVVTEETVLDELIRTDEIVDVGAMVC